MEFYVGQKITTDSTLEGFDRHPRLYLLADRGEVTEVTEKTVKVAWTGQSGDGYKTGPAYAYSLDWAKREFADDTRPETLEQVYGTKEFYGTKAADVQKWLDEFMNLMYPPDETVESETQDQADARVHTGRVRATWIIERMAEMGLAAELPKLIANHEAL